MSFLDVSVLVIERGKLAEHLRSVAHDSSASIFFLVWDGNYYDDCNRHEDASERRPDATDPLAVRAVWDSDGSVEWDAGAGACDFDAGPGFGLFFPAADSCLVLYNEATFWPSVSDTAIAFAMATPAGSLRVESARGLWDESFVFLVAESFGCVRTGSGAGVCKDLAAGIARHGRRPARLQASGNRLLAHGSPCLAKDFKKQGDRYETCSVLATGCFCE